MVIKNKNLRMKNLIYKCVTCNVGLIIDNASASCPKCGEIWKSKDEIFDFSTIQLYWNQISTKEMDIIIKEAKNKGWKQAISNFFGDERKYLQDYIVKSSRADWMLFAPVKTDSTILDIGSGWGAVVVELAKKYKEVYATDCNIDTLKFLKVRSEQEGIKNLKFVKTNPLDYPTLPFTDSSFDMIVLNGILEWVGSARVDNSPDRVQFDALIELHRLLKPDGFIYLGIENRWYFRHFLAGTPHGELPFISVLPRRIANILTLLIRKQKHRTFIYSKKGYIKLFEKAGYKVKKVYGIKPSYHFPKIMVPMEDSSNSFLKFINSSTNNFFKRGIKFCLGLMPGNLLISSYGIFAQKIDNNDN